MKEFAGTSEEVSGRCWSRQGCENRTKQTAVEASHTPCEPPGEPPLLILPPTLGLCLASFQVRVALADCEMAIARGDVEGLLQRLQVGRVQQETPASVVRAVAITQVSCPGILVAPSGQVFSE